MSLCLASRSDVARARSSRISLFTADRIYHRILPYRVQRCLCGRRAGGASRFFGFRPLRRRPRPVLAGPRRGTSIWRSPGRARESDVTRPGETQCSDQGPAKRKDSRSSRLNPQRESSPVASLRHQTEPVASLRRRPGQPEQAPGSRWNSRPDRPEYAVTRIPSTDVSRIAGERPAAFRRTNAATRKAQTGTAR
jgi:hypothetical protein